jgi:hypothetical protein
MINNRTVQSIFVGLSYVIVFAVLVIFKFNFIYPSDENEFIFSGDSVRPITTEAAHSYYLRTFVLNDHSSAIDVTAPIRLVYWALVLSFAYVMPLTTVYWLLIVVTHVFGASLIALSVHKIMRNTKNENRFWQILVPLLPSLFYLFSYPVNYRPYWLFLPLLPAILCFVLAVNYDVQRNARKLVVAEKIPLMILGYLSILQPHLYVIILSSTVLITSIEMLFRKVSGLPLRACGASSLRIMFWYSMPFALVLIPIALLQYVYNMEIAPDYAYNLNVLKMMSENGGLLNSLTFSNGFWEKVILWLYYSLLESRKKKHYP